MLTEVVIVEEVSDGPNRTEQVKSPGYVDASRVIVIKEAMYKRGSGVSTLWLCDGSCLMVEGKPISMANKLGLLEAGR